jgi:hypothetical protein
MLFPYVSQLLALQQARSLALGRTMVKAGEEPAD